MSSPTNRRRRASSTSGFSMSFSSRQALPWSGQRQNRNRNRKQRIYLYLYINLYIYIKNPQLQRRPTSHFATLSNTFRTPLPDLESRNMSKPRDRRSEDQHVRWRLSSLFLAISLAAAAANPRRKSLPRLAKTQDMLTASLVCRYQFVSRQMSHRI